jgi:hypothetical protein
VHRKHWKEHKPNCINIDNVVSTPFVPPVGKMSKFSAGVVWLHGLGDSGAGWSFLQHEIGASLAKTVGGPLKWVFPTAPTAPVTCNGGFSMTSWMDLDDIPVSGLRTLGPACCLDLHACLAPPPGLSRTHSLPACSTNPSLCWILLPL